MARTIVLPDRYVPAPTPGDPDFDKFEPMDIMEQLQTEWETDAHTTLYEVPGAEHWPRHATDTLAFYHDRASAPRLRVVMCDCDFPDHSGTTWADEEAWDWFDAFSKLLPELGCGVYATKGGCRLLWRLAEPLAVNRATATLSQFFDELGAKGVPVDKACKDWTRLFRLPRVVRDGERSEPFFEDYSMMRPLRLSPPVAAEPDRAPLADVQVLDLDMPRMPTRPPTPDELEEIEHAIKPHIYTNIVEGYPLSSPGSRHRDTRSTVFAIMNTFDTADPYTPWRILAHSYQAMCEVHVDSGMAKLWETCLEVGARRRAEIERAEQLQRDMAKLMGTSERVAMRQLIVGVTNLSQFYVWDVDNKEYTGPHNKEWLPSILERQCSELPVTIFNGKRRKTIAQLLDQYGSPIDGVIYDLGLDVKSKVVGSYLHLRGFERRDIKPKRHGDVEQWLQILGGDNEDQLLDWIATFPQLGSPTCALFLEGPPGSGKSLLAKGLVQLWADEPINYDLAVQRFNRVLVETPLVLADEARKGLKDGSTFRNLVGGVGLSVEVKFGGNYSVMGFPRLCITANNDHFLRTQAILTREDGVAIRERIGHLQVNREAVAFLESLGGFRYINPRWIDQHWIAEHCLWLAETRKVERAGRWLVEGWKTRLFEHMPTTVEAANELCAILAKLVAEARRPNGVVIGDGAFWVRFSSVPQIWSQMSPDTKPPGTQDLRDVLHSLTDEDSSVQKRVGTRNIAMWKLEPRYVAQVAQDCGICSADEIFEAAAKRT